MDIDPIYHRHEAAARLTSGLLGSDPLHHWGRTGLFLFAPRRTGKTTFLRADLIPTVVRAGAVAVYVDLWSDRTRDPADLIAEAVADELRAVASTVRRKMSDANRIKKLGVKGNAAGFGAEFGFELDSVAKQGGTTLTKALEALAEKAGKQIVLIIDEAQHALSTRAGEDTLFALKAARDRLNSTAAVPRLAILATGSVRSKVSDMVLRRTQPFYGASVDSFPTLDHHYIDHFLKITLAHRMREDQLPDPGKVLAAFLVLGSRPEELTQAVANAILKASQLDLGEAIVDAAYARREALLEHTRRQFSSLTPLQQAIVKRYAVNPFGAAFDREALTTYQRATANPGIAASHVQKALESLIRQGLFWRSSVGEYAIDDELLADLVQNDEDFREYEDLQGSSPKPKDLPDSRRAKSRGGNRR